MPRVEVLGAAVISLALVAYALQGYLPWVGILNNNPLGYGVRTLLTGAGLLLALPERWTTLVGLGAAAAVYSLAALLDRTRWLPLVQRVTAGQQIKVSNAGR